MCPTSDALREGWRVSSRDDRYEVHFDGRVRNSRTGRVLKPQQAGSGRYAKINLGRSLQVQLHVLICETWHGPKPAGLPTSVDHVDFDSTRNVVTNVRWLRNSANFGQHRSDWAYRAQLLAEEPPSDFTPITPEEERELLDRLARNGWNT